MVEDHKVHDGKKEEKKIEVAHAHTEHKHDEHADHTHEHKTEAKHDHEHKAEDKKTEVKKDKKVSTGPKKTEAVVNGRNLSVGSKHAIAICNFIRGKDVDTAIKLLEDVVKMKIAMPMRGEIPHRHGMMSGRYPIKACAIYITLLKSLKSNAIANELELEKFEIYAMPNVAPRPYKRYGQGRFKRSHVLLKLVALKTKVKKQKNKVVVKK